MKVFLPLVTAFLVVCCSDAINLDQTDFQFVIRQAIRQSERRMQSLAVYHHPIHVSDEELNLDGCSCHNNTCSCCAHMKVPEIHLDDTVCLQVSYLPSEIGVSVALTLDGKVLFQEKISAKNPPPICADIPHLKEMASLCLRLYDLDFKSKHFSGCADIEAKLVHVTLLKVNLGCFQFPLHQTAWTKDCFRFVLNKDFPESDAMVSPYVTYQDVSVAGPHANLQSCSCENDNCGCCLHLEVKAVGLNDTVCLNVTYLPSELGVRVALILDGRILIQETVSAKNPPPMCVGIPYLKELASICLQMYDLEIKGKEFSGCGRIEVRLAGLVLAKINLGCFHFPLLHHVPAGHTPRLIGSRH